MSTEITDGQYHPWFVLCWDRILSFVHAKQAVYRLRHISSPPSFLIKFLGWDCQSVVDGMPGPGLIPTTANMLGGSVPSRKEHKGSSHRGLWNKPFLCTMLQILHNRVCTVWGSRLLELVLRALTAEHNPFEGEQKTQGNDMVSISTQGTGQLQPEKKSGT